MNEPGRDPTLDEALARFLDGEPEPTDGERLAEAMRADPSFAIEVGRLLMLDDLLRQDAMGDDRAFLEAIKLRLAAAREGDSFVRRFSASARMGRAPSFGRRNVSIGATIATCAALIVGATVLRQRDAFEGRNPPRPADTARVRGAAPLDPSGSPIAVEVAVLTRVVGARWAKGGPSPTEGSALNPGLLRLEAGFVQIEFFSGASVILEGPSDFELISAVRAFCRRGRLQTHVPPNARGFTIGAPGLDAVDLGTEFTMSVEESGRGELNVLNGEVELHGAGDRPVIQDVKTLKAGRGANFAVDRGVLEGVARANGFVDRSELLKLQGSQRQDRHRRWLLKSLALRSDPSALLYFSFEDQDGWDRTLKNQGAGRGRAIDGAIVGCLWAEGRWPGRKALEFKRTSDRVRINVPDPHEAVTFTTWVRIEGLNRWFSSLMLTDVFGVGAPHWQISDEGRLILGVKYKVGHSMDYASEPVIGPKDLGRWVHLATVYDNRARVVTHFLDGRPINQNSINEPVALQIGDADIGNWNISAKAALKVHAPHRSLNGRIDEFGIFSRALSPAEILEMYEVGRPVE